MRIGTIGAALAATLLAACATRPAVEDYSATYPNEIPSETAGNGAIFQAGRDVALFENPIAHRPGDIVTIRLAESTNAQKSSNTTTKKSTSVDLPGPTIAGRPVTVHGTPILEAGMENATSFDGSGNSSQSNRLQGDLTVTVAKRLANGNLLVRGEKWIGINQGKEYVRIQGVIRPIDIQPDNSIPSYKVADARISYGGKGATADANSMGWLARFFNSPLTPF